METLKMNPPKYELSDEFEYIMSEEFTRVYEGWKSGLDFHTEMMSIPESVKHLQNYPNKTTDIESVLLDHYPNELVSVGYECGNLVLYIYPRDAYESGIKFKQVTNCVGISPTFPSDEMLDISPSDRGYDSIVKVVC